MRLTDRDEQIINYCMTGATLDLLARMYFPSYGMASKRLVKLVDAKLLKQTINPTFGKKVYYSAPKPPSYHTIVVNYIKYALRGKYTASKREYVVADTLVDFAVELKTGRLLIFEINIFKHTTQGRVNYLRSVLDRNGKKYDIWVVKWARPGAVTTRRRLNGAEIIEIDKLIGRISALY